MRIHVLSAGLLCGLLAAGGAWPADPPMEVTTDTPDYCAQLARAVGARNSQLAEVQRLLMEGRELCGRGEVRGGIVRLRRALVMLNQDGAAPP
jgi:hypothetical protein